MSEINGAASFPRAKPKRQSKLTEKAFLLKLEKLQHERKGFVSKMKALIPEMKGLMHKKENVFQVKESLGALNELSEKAIIAHEEVLPLFPKDKTAQQMEWFSSIMTYSETFKNYVQKGLDESEPDVSDKGLFETNGKSSLAQTNETNGVIEHCLNTKETADELKPSDSASNIGTCISLSTTSSARLKAETELAALGARQKLLEERHSLEEEEERLRKRKEKLQLTTEIAEKMATLNILKTRSSISGKSSKVSNAKATSKAASRVSNGMDSYVEKNKSRQTFNVHAGEFIPAMHVKQNTTKNDEKYSQIHNSSLCWTKFSASSGFGQHTACAWTHFKHTSK